MYLVIHVQYLLLRSNCDLLSSHLSTSTSLLSFQVHFSWICCFSLNPTTSRLIYTFYHHPLTQVSSFLSLHFQGTSFAWANKFIYKFKFLIVELKRQEGIICLTLEFKGRTLYVPRDYLCNQLQAGIKEWGKYKSMQLHLYLWNVGKTSQHYLKSIGMVNWNSVPRNVINPPQSTYKGSPRLCNPESRIFLHLNCAALV